MAQQINLGYVCDILRVAVADDNAPQFIGYGAIRAGRSNSNQGLRDQLNNQWNNGRESLDANGNPIVQLQYMLENDGKPITSFQCTGSPRNTNLRTYNWSLGQMLQDGKEYEWHELDKICEAYDKYMGMVARGINIGEAGNNDMVVAFKAINDIKREIMYSMRSMFFEPMEQYLMTKLIAGLNPVTNTTAPTPITMRASYGNWTTELIEHINQIRMATGYEGQYIAIGDMKWGSWFGSCMNLPNVFCCSAITGVNFEAMKQQLGFEFYFSKYVSQFFGPGTLFLMEVDKFALLTYDWLGSLPSTIANEYYSNMTIPLTDSCSTVDITLSTWIQELGLCSTGGRPKFTFNWGTKYDAFVQPESFRYGNNLTGIYQLQWMGN